MLGGVLGGAVGSPSPALGSAEAAKALDAVEKHMAAHKGHLEASQEETQKQIQAQHAAQQRQMEEMERGMKAHMEELSKKDESAASREVSVPLCTIAIETSRNCSV